jgi:hypothetical protein
MLAPRGAGREVVDAGGEKAKAEEAVAPHSQDRRRDESAILISLVIIFSELEVRDVCFVWQEASIKRFATTIFCLCERVLLWMV